MTPRRGVIRSLACGWLVLSLAACQQVYEFPHREAWTEARSVKTGWTEKEIRARLGVPYGEFVAGTPPSVYCISGWQCEHREVRGKLLIYTFGKPVAYYFLDASGKVEYVFVGGS